jgi:hypothetical protein
MAFQPDPLLLELFEAVHQDLATALEARQRLSDDLAEDQVDTVEALTRRIARLRVAAAAIEAAFECRPSSMVH